VRELQRAVRRDRVADRVLHESIRSQNETRRQPTADCDAHCDQEVSARAKPLFPQTNAPTIALSRKNANMPSMASVCQSLRRVFCKCSPVRAKLELHRNSCHDADGKVEAKYFSPRSEPAWAYRSSPVRIAFHFQNTMNHASPIVSLREQIMVDHRKCEVQSMPKRRIAKIWIHSLGLSKDAGASQPLSANLYQSKRNTSLPSHLGHQFADVRGRSTSGEDAHSN